MGFDGHEHEPNNAPLSISLSPPELGPVLSKLADELLRCLHRYGVSPGDGVSRPCYKQQARKIRKEKTRNCSN